MKIKNYDFLIIIILSIVLIVIMLNNLWLWYLINMISPCKQNIYDSFPCYWITDILSWVFLEIIISFFTTKLIFKYINIKNKLLIIPATIIITFIFWRFFLFINLFLIQF